MRNSDILIGGALVTAIGTGITEVEYHKRSTNQEAIIVSLVGGSVTGLFTYLLQTFGKAQPPQKKETLGESIRDVLISTVLTFIASEVGRRAALPLLWQGVLVGVVGGATWSLLKYRLYSSSPPPPSAS